MLQQRRRLYPDFARLVDLASAIPPQFSADLLLRIAASQELHDSAWKKELLEDAFQNANLAPDPIRRKVIRSEMVARSRAEMMSLGFDQRLDRLSLQTLAVREMLSLDKSKALETFNQVTLPKLLPRSCRDGLVDHVADYFDTEAGRECGLQCTGSTPWPACGTSKPRD